MLRVPTEPICWAHPLWIPKLDKPRVRPAGGSDQNLAAFFRFGCLCNHIATKSRRQRTQIRFSEIDCLNCDDAERSRRHEQSVVRSSFFSQRLQRPSICKGNVALRCRFVTRLPLCHAQLSRALARLRRAWANDRPAGTSKYPGSAALVSVLEQAPGPVCVSAVRIGL